MKPLRRFLKLFYSNPIPLMALMPLLVELFNGLKKGVTSSPVLEIFYPGKPTFLNTEWRA